MGLFIVRHEHTDDHCPATDPLMGATLLNHLSRPNVSAYGLKIHGEAVVKGEHKLGAVGPEALQGMRQARRKIPEITFGDVGHIRTASGVERRDAAMAVGHDRPFRLLVPVEFPDAACRKAHVHPRDLGRDGEVGLSDLPAPAPILDSPGRQVERGPKLRKASDVGRRRAEKSRNRIREP